jgi:thiosulfate sulfurtransferase
MNNTPMYKEIEPEAATKLITDSHVTIVDIRDTDSYHTGHLESAIQLNDSTLSEFLDQTSRENTLLVYCYHGISSAGATSLCYQSRV